MTYKLTFEYFDRNDDRTYASLHGYSKEDVCDRAYKWSLDNGDGEFSPVEMIKSNGNSWTKCELPEVGHYNDF